MDFEKHINQNFKGLWIKLQFDGKKQIFFPSYLKALIVITVRLGRSEQRQQSSHGHFMVENTLTRVESTVRHF